MSLMNFILTYMIKMIQLFKKGLVCGMTEWYFTEDSNGNKAMVKKKYYKELQYNRFKENKDPYPQKVDNTKHNLIVHTLYV